MPKRRPRTPRSLFRRRLVSPTSIAGSFAIRTTASSNSPTCSANHRQIARAVRAGIGSGRLIALTGPIGVGKTVFLHCLQDDIASEKEGDRGREPLGRCRAHHPARSNARIVFAGLRPGSSPRAWEYLGNQRLGVAAGARSTAAASFGVRASVGSRLVWVYAVHTRATSSRASAPTAVA